MTLALVLASTSPFRRELLMRLKVDFTQDSPETDETPKANESAEHLCQRLAIAKAHAISQKYTAHLIIGSDQVATFAGDVVGKPLTHHNAVQQLTRFSGHHVDFYTGLCLLNSQTKAFQYHVEHFRVYFRALTNAQIERYLLAEQPYQCAGSFKSEGLGVCLFERLEGNDPTSLIGLPLIKLVSMLEQEGVCIP
jgi:septum formation protein